MEEDSESSRRPIKKLRQACDSCHFKKLRCIRGNEGQGGTCERCRVDGLDCVFSPALKTGRPKRVTVSAETKAVSVQGESLPQEPTDQPSVGGSSLSSEVPSLALPTSQNEVPNITDPPSFLGSVAAPAVVHNAPVPETNFFDPYALTDLDLAVFDPSFVPLAVPTPDLIEETAVLGALETLAALHKQLISTRRQLSSSLSEVIEISATTIDTAIRLWSSGVDSGIKSNFLQAISDETAITVILGPLMFVLEVYEDVLKLVAHAAGRTQAIARNSEEEELPHKAPAAAGMAETINPTLPVTGPVTSGQSATLSPSPLPSHFALRMYCFNLYDPTRQYVVLTTLVDQLDRLRAAVDRVIGHFTLLNVAHHPTKMTAVLMDRFRRRTASLHMEATRQINEAQVPAVH